MGSTTQPVKTDVIPDDIGDVFRLQIYVGKSVLQTRGVKAGRV